MAFGDVVVRDRLNIHTCTVFMLVARAAKLIHAFGTLGLVSTTHHCKQH